MKHIERRALLLALCLTMALTGLLLYFLQSKALNTGPLVKAVVAVSNIPAKSIISAKDVAELTVPSKYAMPGVYTAKDQVIGKIAKENIYKEEQLIPEKVIRGIATDGLSAVLPPGFRAISCKIDPVSGVGGQIKKGDYIDILVYLKPPYLEQDSVKTMFQNIEVIEISQPKGNEERILTIALSPQDTEKFFLISELGKLRIVLRPVTEKDTFTLPETTILSIR